MGNSKSLLKLSNNDNVLVLTSNVVYGEVLDFNGNKFQMATSIELGHKIALNDIMKGQKIIKFNVSIGSATQDIKRGEHVHIQNMKSDFIPSTKR